MDDERKVWGLKTAALIWRAPLGRGAFCQPSEWLILPGE